LTQTPPPRAAYTEEITVGEHNSRSLRFRYTATGALAALAAVGAIAGTSVLAATPRAKPHGHVAVAGGSPTKTPASPLPGKAQAPQAGSSQPFLADAQRLVTNGTITATEGQALDAEILQGRVDSDTLASSGFTRSQLDAVQQALSGTKQALAASAPRASK
jgi:hypothetical protein